VTLVSGDNMKIGLTYDVKTTGTLFAAGQPGPDDLQEEFDSPETIDAIAAAIHEIGHEVVLIGDGPSAVARLMNGDRPDLVFNIAEGEGIGRSREARMPAVLELLDIPYTGSDPLTLALTLDKVRTKVVVAAEGVRTPAWAAIDSAGVGT
jgi:D-alanine-D-alanine ligase